MSLIDGAELKEVVTTYNDECIGRFEEWCNTIPNYHYMTKNQRKRAKKKMKNLTATEVIKRFASMPTAISLEHSDYNQVPMEAQCNKKENNMCYECDDYEVNTPDEKKANFLLNQLDYALRSKDNDLRQMFKINEPAGPMTIVDFLDRMKMGKYTVSKYFLNDDGTIKSDARFASWGLQNIISWRTADDQPDTKGYEAAEKKLELANTDAYRTIQVGTPAEGLAALKAFEAVSFT